MMKHIIMHTMKAAVSALALMGMSLMAPIAAQAQDQGVTIVSSGINVPNQEVGDIYRAGLELMGNGDWAGARLKWRAGTNLGNPPSMGMLAQTYIEGLGGAKDLERGLDLAERAAELGGNIGKLYLSKAYLTGEGRDVNIALGVQLASEAIDGDFAKQYPYELWKASVLHNRAVAQATTDEEARRLFEYSADLLSRITDSDEFGAKAIDVLLQWYGENKYLVDFDKLRAIAEPAAENGHPAAAWWMSVWHYQMRDNGGDQRQARFWAEQAVAEGYERAYSWLGAFYEVGIGGPKDHAEACRLNEKAKEVGGNVQPVLNEKCGQ